jgi:hypothetical protein
MAVSGSLVTMTGAPASCRQASSSGIERTVEAGADARGRAKVRLYVDDCHSRCAQAGGAIGAVQHGGGSGGRKNAGQCCSSGSAVRAERSNAAFQDGKKEFLGINRDSEVVPKLSCSNHFFWTEV